MTTRTSADAKRSDRSSSMTSKQGTAPTLPRTVTVPCHPATRSNEYEVHSS
ncbi:hypothetical protein HNR30_003440 [Nonomuraea soli]|uniref:Uncharacterized protein n=1 Tax=Nonomuraea soli TaxID=1032476 RepID=A0A7W0CJ04_9ACTN|nr:hypothetical protein [Nonomuraea soli]